VLTATVRGAGKAPASVLSTGSLAPRKAELGRAPPILIPRGGPQPCGSETKIARVATGSAEPRRAELGRACPDSHLSWRPQAMGVLSAIEGSPLCNPAFSQVAADRRGRSNAFKQAAFKLDQPRHVRPVTPPWCSGRRSGSSSVRPSERVCWVQTRSEPRALVLIGAGSRVPAWPRARPLHTILGRFRITP
jgi:hypothetical protein